MSGKTKIEWKLRLKIDSDWLIKGAGQQGFISSSPMLDGLGRPYIPASTIKGLLRHEFRKISSIYPNLVDKLIAYESFLFGRSGNQQGHLYFSEATIKDSSYWDQYKKIRTRIAINRKQRVAQDQALIVEQIAISSIELHTDLCCYAKEAEMKDIAGLITLCFLNLDHIGSGKSIGRGKVNIQYQGQGKKEEHSSELYVMFDGLEWSFEQLKQTVQAMSQSKEGS